MFGIFRFWLVSLLILPSLPNAQSKRLRTCGFDSLNPDIAVAERTFQKKVAAREFEDLEKRAAPTLQTLKVYWHIISANSTIEGGNIPASQINAQIAVLNATFVPRLGLSWRLVNTSRTISAELFNGPAPGNAVQTKMKKSLRRGTAKDLNVYSVGFTSGDAKGILGYSTFPSSYQQDPIDDGVVLLFSTVPGGSTEDFNEGKTLVHEAGHWVGLYHTFQGGCGATGDYVQDTAKELSAAYGCPTNLDSCPGGGKDPIHNFMDYTDDSCMTGFTVGQATRARAQLKTYRNIPA